MLEPLDTSRRCRYGRDQGGAHAHAQLRFRRRVLRHGAVPREEIGGGREGALCHSQSRAIHDHVVTLPAFADRLRWTHEKSSREEEDHMPSHKVVKHDERLKARKRHLAKEKSSCPRPIQTISRSYLQRTTPGVSRSWLSSSRYCEPRYGSRPHHFPWRLFVTVRLRTARRQL